MLLLAVACGCASDAPTSDARAADTPAPPIDPTGRYVVTSAFALTAAPPAAAAVLDELRAATDGPDDPSRYLIDLMIERLPESHVRTYAAALAPYVAAYLNDRLAMVAPRFVAGTRALAFGLTQTAQRFGAAESFDIASDGSLRRTVIAFRFDAVAPRASVVEVPIAEAGFAELTAISHASVSGDGLTIDRSWLPLPYTRMLRVGFDRAVIASVTPDAHDLAQALQQLVDCPRLGTLVADWLGLGTPELYARGCSVGLTALASRIYARIDAIAPAALPLDLAGTARAVDANRDGTLDAIAGGVWTGNLASAAVSGNFDGERQ